MVYLVILQLLEKSVLELVVVDDRRYEYTDLFGVDYLTDDYGLYGRVVNSYGVLYFPDDCLLLNFSWFINEESVFCSILFISNLFDSYLLFSYSSSLRLSILFSLSSFSILSKSLRCLSSNVSTFLIYNCN